MANETDFLGIGWAFPPSFEIETASTAMVNDIDDINQSLWILFTTEIGERVMQPNYGSALKTMLFENMNEHFKNYMRLVLLRSIELYETRIRPLSIQFSDEKNGEGQYLMSLDYQIVNTNNRFNFVFPFYLNQ